jgi:hypothetical protein
MKPKILLKYEQTDIDSRTGVVIEPRVTRLFGVKIKLKTVGEKTGAKVSAKVPALWIAAFQGDKLVIQLRIGSEQHTLGEFDVGTVTDGARRREIIQGIKAEGILDAAEVAAFLRRHPDKARLAELRQMLADKLRALDVLKSEVGALKAELVGSGG